MGLSGCVGRLGDRYREVPDRFHHGLDVFGVLLAKLVAAKPHRIILVGFKALGFRKRVLNHAFWK